MRDLNGMVGRTQGTLLNERYQVGFRKEIYQTEEEEFQMDWDAWIQPYNQRRSHQGRSCFRKTPK